MDTELSTNSLRLLHSDLPRDHHNTTAPTHTSDLGDGDSRSARGWRPHDTQHGTAIVDQPPTAATGARAVAWLSRSLLSWSLLSTSRDLVIEAEPSTSPPRTHPRAWTHTAGNGTHTAGNGTHTAGNG
eukprot:Lankesteria_metandrocarpae@DN3181_c0_g1_i1.p1